jgi:hypothetical protein
MSNIEPGLYTRPGAIIGRKRDGSALHDERTVVTVLTGKTRNLVYDFEAEPCVRVSAEFEPDCWVAVRELVKVA